jgi:hypothetical protein
MFTPKRKSGQIAWPEQFGVFLRAVVFFVGKKFRLENQESVEVANFVAKFESRLVVLSL